MTYQTARPVAFGRDFQTGQFDARDGAEFTLPAGTAVQLIREADGIKGDLFAVADASDVAEAAGGSGFALHDAQRHYLFLPADAVVRADGTPAADDLNRSPADIARRRPALTSGQVADVGATDDAMTLATAAAMVASATGDAESTVTALRDLFGGVAPYPQGWAAQLLADITEDLRDGYGDMMDENPNCIPCHVLSTARRLAIMAATVEPDAVVISGAHLARLVYAAESYVEDLADGLRDGTYEDEDGENSARLVAIRAAITTAPKTGPGSPITDSDLVGVTRADLRAAVDWATTALEQTAECIDDDDGFGADDVASTDALRASLKEGAEAVAQIEAAAALTPDFGFRKHVAETLAHPTVSRADVPKEPPTPRTHATVTLDDLRAVVAFADAMAPAEFEPGEFDGVADDVAEAIERLRTAAA